VVHLATRIPPLSRARWARAWRENDRLRSEGAERLVNAALAANAKVFVQESITFFYADGGERWLYETAPIAVVGPVASALDAEREATRLTENGGRGVVLRFATFYGADALSTQDTIRLARWRLLPIIGDGARYISSIQIDDAARAVVAALDVPAGIYNVTDDEPARFTDYVRAVTDAFGCPPPRRLPAWTAGPLLGAVAPIMTRSQRIANKLFKGVTGWTPRYGSAREGFAAIASAGAVLAAEQPSF
jgi:nucleoside-diphosphate-sugar epimerase